MSQLDDTPNDPLMILMSFDDCLTRLVRYQGVKKASIIVRNSNDVAFTPTSVIRSYIKHQRRDDIMQWCETVLDGNHSIDFALAIIYFESEEDSLLFLLRWKGEDVAHSFM
jgi:hypothetical protein